MFGLNATGKKILVDAAMFLPPVRRLRGARDALLAERDALQSACARLTADEGHGSQLVGSPFFHYHASFDAKEVVRRHAAPDLQATPGYLTNYLGVRIDPKFFPSLLQGREGTVEPMPIPCNWHADLSEWAAALRAVDLSAGSFTMIELGCGWGCWMNNTGVAARRAGRAVHLIGVEGDEGHLGFAREACATNGFVAGEVTLRRGIVAPASGIALFPRQGQAGLHWGLEPVFGATEEQRRVAAKSGQFDELPMIALGELAAPHPRIDLLHIDIQGGEADFIAGCLPVMQEKVAYMLVGTHSRPLEGQIIAMMLEADWEMEIERPGIFDILGGRPRNLVDGVQGWRNPALLP